MAEASCSDAIQNIQLVYVVTASTLSIILLRFLIGNSMVMVAICSRPLRMLIHIPLHVRSAQDQRDYSLHRNLSLLDQFCNLLAFLLGRQDAC